MKVKKLKFLKFEIKLDFELLKNYYFDLIRKRFLMKHKSEFKQKLIEEDLIENVIKPSDLSNKDKFIRNLLVLIDFLLEELELKVKFDDNDSFYSIKIRKVVLGTVKGINKHKEMHFISFFYDIQLSECIAKNPDHSSYFNLFNLLSLRKFFVNLKLEYGLFPKDYYTLLNTINLKSELVSGKVNISSRSLNSMFSFIVNILIKFNLFYLF